MVIREMAGPFGVPDFLAVTGPSGLVEARFSLEVPPLLNEIDAGIASAASATVARTSQAFAGRLGWSGATVERRLPHLLRCGALLEQRSGQFVRPASLLPVGRLTAIETKVTNSRRAIRQGRIYRLWCETYVIVMPQISVGSLDELLAAVDADRAGLMIAGRWLRRPRQRRSGRAHAMWGSEHLVAAVVGGGVTSPQSRRTAPSR